MRYKQRKTRKVVITRIHCDSNCKDGMIGGILHYNTIHRFIKRNNLKSQGQRFTKLSDDDIMPLIKRISHRFTNSGCNDILSHLRNETPPLIIQRDKLRILLDSADPVGVALNWSQAITRRTYSVPTPNSLWHIDSNHKLIRYPMLLLTVTFR